MRYLVAITVAITVAAAALMAGCAQPPGKDAQPPAEAAQPFGNRVEGSRDAQVYEQVLRRYAESPSENSFPGKTFKTVYVLDHAHPDAADPMGQKGSGVAIPLEDQGWITAALAP